MSFYASFLGAQDALVDHFGNDDQHSTNVRYLSLVRRENKKVGCCYFDSHAGSHISRPVSVNASAENWQ